VTILFKKYTLKAIWVGGFVRIHGIESGRHFFFGYGASEGVPIVIIKGGVAVFIESVVLVKMVVTTEKVFKIL